MSGIRYTRIQRFCLHDGPGIRTTVFLFGCNLRCPWCCNPENITHKDGWPCECNEPGRIARELLKDAAYYAHGGGVTYSGGEPLLQAKSLLPLMSELKAYGIHQAVETALFVDRESVERVVGSIDSFLVDVKVLDRGVCSSIVGGDLLLYKENLSYLMGRGAHVRLRMPLIEGFTTGQDNVNGAIELAREFAIREITLLKGHSLASAKSGGGGLRGVIPSDAVVEGIKNAFEHSGIRAEVFA